MKFAPLLIKHHPHLARHVLPLIAARKLHTSNEHAHYLQDAESALRQAGHYSRKTLRDISLVRARFMADQMFLAHADPHDIGKLAPTICEHDINYAAVRRYVQDGRPLLFGCSYFGFMFFALLAMKGWVKELLVVAAGDPRPGLRLFEKISLACGFPIQVVGSAESTVALRIFRQLGRGGTVATMLDCYYGADTDLYTDFLGKPAASPGALYRLGQRAGAIVVPTASIYRDGSQVLDIGEALDLRSLSGEQASQRVNDYFSQLVRSYPGQWMGWSNLWARWNMAHRP
ncbi:hypothetical protein [Dyella acidiphila]|uniref:Uncharacterized protein n=1 Tax=Dyella acidiphila TaxID=2775866 RepID=A0ABR9G884_9GAMM|nr:hypothetical protein [Dyella acidiphila]MBE1160274.1 hypothetical protein [Dyella acidiphila]